MNKKLLMTFLRQKAFNSLIISSRFTSSSSIFSSSTFSSSTKDAILLNSNVDKMIKNNNNNNKKINNKESKVESIDANEFRSTHGIKCFGESVPHPFYSFDDYSWPLDLKERMDRHGFHSPTPIQAQSLPIIFQKRDVVGIANSGSGKTLSFVLPALVHTLTSSLYHWPKILILTPTRELTHQIDSVVRKFKFTRSVCIYGGVSREIQMMLLSRGNPHIVIATPARLNDIIDRAVAHLKHVDYLVIDEADRMLAMGDEKAFRNIMSLLPKRKRQTLMFSATWPERIESLANEFLKDHVRVTVSGASESSSFTVCKNIKQIVEICEEEDKQEKLIECLNKYLPTVSGLTKTMIFVRKKETADALIKFIRNNHYHCRAFHGGKSQPERNFVLREFRKGTIPVIICTDVAARGLDFQHVKLVINYDFPQNIETYIHRIGRTGRHFTQGTALTLFTPRNSHHAKDLIRVLSESNQVIKEDLIALSKIENNLNLIQSEDESDSEDSVEFDSDEKK